MISKVIIGKTFSGACKYICADKTRAVVLHAEGVRGYNHKFMAADFESQHALRPTLSKAVFHGILSFYPGEKIADEKMVEIGMNYLEKLGITNTQYAITKHTDKNHSHLHILANLINNNGDVIKDNWIGLKGKKVAQELTMKNGLKTAESKNLRLTNLNSLNKEESTKYFIYQAISNNLPVCNNLDELKDLLVKRNIETLYKFKGQTDELQGISFKLGEYKFKGSEIDRKFSITNLQKTFYHQELKAAFRATGKIPKELLLFRGQNQQAKLSAGQSNSMVHSLMKPENIQQASMPTPLLEKKRKKKRRGLHL